MVLGIFKKLKAGLSKTRQLFGSKIKDLLSRRKLDEETIEELEELLLTSDMGPNLVEHIIDELQQLYRKKEISEDEDVYEILKQRLRESLAEEDLGIRFAETGPTVILVAGVNGSGKTTSIAKLANLFTQEGKTVLLCAGDTFRAAAVEQLSIWAERLGIDIIKHQSGADPAAVCYDAIDAGIARNVDVIIVDTAGRLHTQINLMRELEKINRIIQKKIPEGPHETLLVIDSTTGQNGIQQAKHFNEILEITGIILAKFDGTAKGGVIFPIKKEIGIPVKFIGIGESIDDIAYFDPDDFINSLFE